MCLPRARLPMSLGLHRQLTTVVSGFPLFSPGYILFHRTRFIINTTKPHCHFTCHSVVASYFWGQEAGKELLLKALPDQQAPACDPTFVPCLLHFSINVEGTISLPSFREVFSTPKNLQNLNLLQPFTISTLTSSILPSVWLCFHLERSQAQVIDTPQCVALQWQNSSVLFFFSQPLLSFLSPHRQSWC